MALFHSFLWLSSIPLYLSICVYEDVACMYMHICHIFFIHSSVGGHLSCFHFLVIVNGSAVNIGMRASFQIIILSGCVPRSGIYGLYGIQLFFNCSANSSSQELAVSNIHVPWIQINSFRVTASHPTLVRWIRNNMRLLLCLKDNWPCCEMYTGGSYPLVCIVILADWEGYAHHTAVFAKNHRQNAGWAEMGDIPGNGWKRWACLCWRRKKRGVRKLIPRLWRANLW